MAKTKHLEKIWILLVEDDPSVQAYFKQILPGESYFLHVVDNGKTAMECIEGIEFDIIILDFNLKGDLNGFDILKKCRRLTSARIYSNTGSPEHSAKMSLLGADQALYKNSYLIHKALGLEMDENFVKRKGHVEQALDEMKNQE